ncbi:TetR/AcrR family transcriptional regulator [Rhodococcus qingshengii]|uniref:TetR/AcrR family transcriptional regulator n=1 Tax=Rhodococcus qingshengii TaxID=334542 RepID=UPI0036DE0093
MAADNRRHILLAAEELLQDHASFLGGEVSLEEVAGRVGLPCREVKSYFPTRRSLSIGLIEHATRRWSELLTRVAGRGAEELSAYDRYRIYVTATMTSEVSRVNYWIFSDARNQPTLPSVWSEHLGPWLATDGLGSRVRSYLSAARFCADGALFAKATGMIPVDNLDAVRLHALRLIDEAEDVQ